MRILIVEDDDILNKLFKEILSPYGECDTAFNGTEAVESFERAWAESRPYDLICMDIIMPHTNGYEALSLIRQLEVQYGIRGTNRVKVIMTTAVNDPTDVTAAAYAWGASAYLVKPISKTDLVQELDNLGMLSDAVKKSAKNELKNWD
jgi:two-component system chemotaxis response regulator CheY